MLELRPTCEHCDTPLPPESTEARICSYECTFCATCVVQVLGNVCPNCGGGFVARPVRPARNWNGDNSLDQDPAAQMPGQPALTTPMRTIDAGTLALEPQTRDHAEEMFAVLSDPAIYTYENEPPPSVDWLRTRFEKLESRQSADGAEHWLNWVIRLAGNGLIGYVQATVRRDGSAAIAYEMGSAHWGRGLGRCATEVMIRELIDQYRVTTLFAVAKSGNFRSLRLLERLGFATAGPDLRAARGALQDETLMFRNVERS